MPRLNRRLEALEQVLRPSLPNHTRYHEWTDEQLMEVVRSGGHEALLDLINQLEPIK